MLGASLPGIATIHKSSYARMLGVKEAPGILLSNVKRINCERFAKRAKLFGFGERFQLR